MIYMVMKSQFHLDLSMQKMKYNVDNATIKRSQLNTNTHIQLYHIPVYLMSYTSIYLICQHCNFQSIQVENTLQWKWGQTLYSFILYMYDIGHTIIPDIGLVSNFHTQKNKARPKFGLELI